MRRHISALLILIFSSICISSFASAVPTSLAPMLKRVTPAIVNIFVKKSIPVPEILAKQQLTGKKPRLKSADVGSGVILNAKEGIIVTNAHVVRNAKTIIVTLKDGRRFKGRLLAYSDDFDLAVVKINAKGLTQINLANSNELNVGDFVAAIGSPFDLQQTVTSGMISALDRARPKLPGFAGFIQTDAPINPGNSGGALVNLKGQLIGINTAIFAGKGGGNIGIGFSIPSNVVKAAALQLLKYGKIKRGALGVLVQNLTPNLAQAFKAKVHQGVLVSEVLPNSAAAKGGVHVKDIITAVNGVRVHSSNELRNSVSLMAPGTKAKLSVLRSGKARILSISIGNPKTEQMPHKVYALNGLQLRNVNEVETTGLRLRGALITSATLDSQAALAGLAPGDVIVAVNGVKTPTLNDVMQRVKASKNRLLLSVARDNHQFFVVVP